MKAKVFVFLASFLLISMVGYRPTKSGSPTVRAASTSRYSNGYDPSQSASMVPCVREGDVCVNTGTCPGDCVLSGSTCVCNVFVYSSSSNRGDKLTRERAAKSAQPGFRAD